MVLNNEIMGLLLTTVSPLSGEVYKILTKDKAKLETESNNEENVLSNLEKHTDLLKELAIIRRIDTAENVSIEEFYDTKGDGSLGVQSTEGDINIGLKGSGQKVTKRIYSFEGWRDGSSIGVEDISELIKKMGGSSDDKTE